MILDSNYLFTEELIIVVDSIGEVVVNLNLIILKQLVYLSSGSVLLLL